MPKPFKGPKRPNPATPHVVTLTGQQVLSRYDDLIRSAQDGIAHLETSKTRYKGKGKNLERMRGCVDGLSRAKRVITDND